jgi:hypothetical protein
MDGCKSHKVKNIKPVHEKKIRKLAKKSKLVFKKIL